MPDGGNGKRKDPEARTSLTCSGNRESRVHLGDEQLLVTATRPGFASSQIFGHVLSY